MSAREPMATVRDYIGAFNKGDVEGMATAFAVPSFILDPLAPNVWSGPTAAADWWRDVLIEIERHGASDLCITAGEPLHNDVTGDSAYAFVPATFMYKVRGKQVTQAGAVITVALRKLPDGWRIAAWAWGKGKQ